MRGIIFATIVYLLLLVLVRQIFPESIIFYQGLILAMVVSVGHVGWNLATRTGNRIDALKDVLIVFLLAYSFMFTVPTTVDRSYTVRMLSTLDAAPDGMKRRELLADFEAHFSTHGGVDRRLSEQQQTGTVSIEADSITLTPLGRALVEFFRVNCELFRCHH